MNKKGTKRENLTVKDMFEIMTPNEFDKYMEELNKKLDQ